MDCLASLPKIKQTGCKCITFRTGTIIFSILHLVFYITVGVVLYDLDPNMNFPIMCIFSLASLASASAIIGSILKRSLLIEIYVVFGLITTLILALLTVSAAFISIHFFLLQLSLFSFFVYNILFMNSYSYQLIVASKILSIDIVQVEAVGGNGQLNEYL